MHYVNTYIKLSALGANNNYVLCTQYGHRAIAATLKNCISHNIKLLLCKIEWIGIGFLLHNTEMCTFILKLYKIYKKYSFYIFYILNRIHKTTEYYQNIVSGFQLFSFSERSQYAFIFIIFLYFKYRFCLFVHKWIVDFKWIFCWGLCRYEMEIK